MRRGSLAAGLLLTAAFVALAVTFFLNAGGLWRDEANSASMTEAIPHLHWTDLQFDSFPAAWPLLLRGWIAVAGHTDRAYRALGLIIALALIAAVWLAGRSDRRHVPLLALLLIGTHGGMVRTLSAIRGYGAGTLAMVLLIAALRAVMNRSSPARHFLVLAAALASVHLVYLNCVLVLAAILPAAIVVAIERRWRDSALLMISGAIAAASMLIYLPIVRASRSWIAVLQTDYDLPWFWSRVIEAIGKAGGGGRGALGLWLASVVLALSLAAIARRVVHDRQRLRSVFFGAGMLAVGLPGYFFFLKTIALITSWWYYVPLLVVVAIACDMIVSAVAGDHTSAAATVVVLSLFLFPPALAICKFRQTNVDIIADEVARDARPKDLVLVLRWYNGVSYARYHHARAPWQTSPPVSNHRWHQWDEVGREAHDVHTMDALAAAVDDRLAHGGRIFMITDVPFQQSLPGSSIRFNGTIRQSTWYWESRLKEALRDGDATIVREWEPAPLTTETEKLTLQVWARATS